MADVTAEFFGELTRRGHEPLLQKVTATVRFDLTKGTKTDSWFVTITKGDVAVSRKRAAAACTIHTTKAMFDRLASGEANLMAATLRGEVDVEGNVTLLVLFRRLFPPPPRARRRRSATQARRST